MPHTSPPPPHLQDRPEGNVKLLTVWPFFNLGFWERRCSYITWKGSESQGGVGRVWSSSQDLQEFLVTPGWPDSVSSIRASLVSASTHSTRHSLPLGGGPCPLGSPPTRAFQASSWPPQCILCMDTHLPVFFTFVIRAVLVLKVSPCVSFRCLRCFFSFNPKYSTSYHMLTEVFPWGPSMTFSPQEPHLCGACPLGGQRQRKGVRDGEKDG